MICEKCGKEFTPRKNYKRFCSDKCRNSRVLTENCILKRRNASKKHWKNGRYKHINWSIINNDTDKIKKSEETWTKKFKQKLEEGDNKLTCETIKKYLLKEHGYKCWNCQLTEWLGDKIFLEMDHIDGNNKNNDLTNLRILCPNCHSQTPTWRFKNIKR